ncbi:CsgG/HfaB family protein [Chitinimonas koreensis]|uniref:CsgG/HfaB family protein n=1 Tax=Chitinimonas koreensis TaxID=356302 RepID=UPI000410E641|nr:CsgG/HfaB family protein [Chitinimonas koreensis]
MNRNGIKQLVLAGLCLALGGCGITRLAASDGPAERVPATHQRDLLQLPAPKGRVVVSVYSFRDQTGQFKPQPDSSYSTAVTQGATAWLIKALVDSSWFAPVERENLQNLLTERKIWRALETDKDKAAAAAAGSLPALTPAPIVIEGAVTSYESNVRTGGAGAAFMGYGISGQYRVDQVTVSLRAVNVRTGQILANVIAGKTIWSRELSSGVYRYVSLKRILELEAGYTRNEPVQLCVKEAIETAVAMLVAKGVREGLWLPANPNDPAMAILKQFDSDEFDLSPAQLEKLVEKRSGEG